MVDSGNVTADACDGDLFDAVALGPQGYLAPIDHDAVGKDKTLPQYAPEYGVSVILHGYAFVCDTQAHGDNPPNGWADFFDTARFPGTQKRMTRRPWPACQGAFFMCTALAFSRPRRSSVCRNEASVPGHVGALSRSGQAWR